jgi:hypothetical protein
MTYNQPTIGIITTLRRNVHVRLKVSPPHTEESLDRQTDFIAGKDNHFHLALQFLQTSYSYRQKYGVVDFGVAFASTELAPLAKQAEREVLEALDECSASLS